MRLKQTHFLFWAILSCLAIASSLYLPKRIDLQVYWYGVRDFYAGIRSAYGVDSGVSHPLEYRYPPATYVLLYPLPFVPLRMAAFFWSLAEWVIASLTLWLAIRVRRLHFSSVAIAACCAAMLSYVVLAIRYGNVQPFVICAIFAALILSETRPVWSGLLLALAVTFKIWPILLLPWLLRRERSRAAAYFLVWLAVLWLCPVLVFGVHGYWALLTQWYTAMTSVATTYTEVYYKLGQSLRDVSLRYCSSHIAPRRVSLAVAVLDAAVYCFFAIRMLRSDRSTMWVWDGLAFILYSLIEPFAVRSGLISLAPAVLTGGCLYTIVNKPGSRRNTLAKHLFLSACTVFFLVAIVQYRPLQHFLEVGGLDFWAEILLMAALALWLAGDPPAQQSSSVDRTSSPEEAAV